MTAELFFTKMHGAGNDFVMLNGISQSINPTPDFIRFIANRRLGIGADQVLLVEKAESDVAEFKYRIFNCDGEEVEQCGNGARCFAVFVREEGLTHKKRIFVETKKALISPFVESDGRVTVDMGQPNFDFASLPFHSDGLKSKRVGDIESFSEPAERDFPENFFSVVSMGNPHAVFFVDDVDSTDVAFNGRRTELNSAFPQRVNVGFVEVLRRQEAKLRVWERGAGETLACGTGACAAAVIGICRGYFESEVLLHAKGGDLTVRWNGLKENGAHVYLTGPVTTVFRGKVILPEGNFHD